MAGRGPDVTGNRKGPVTTTNTDPLPSAGTPAVAVSPDIQSQLVKSLVPWGAFVTEDHRYYFNGDGPVPSVTTVLEVLDKPALSTWKAQQAVRAIWRYEGEELADMTEDEAVKWALAEVRKTRTDAASVGTGVHHIADMLSRASESDSKGFQVSESTQPYVDAYNRFLDRYSRSAFVSTEKAVWSLNGYGGTYDLLVMIDGELWLIDIKTGKGLYPEFALQLAGYRWADYIILPGDPTTYDMPNVDRTGVLHLRPDQYPDTGYRLYEYPTTYDSDYMTFLGLLEAYKWRQKQEKPLVLKQ
jgi:hypothetical protein